jgi:hypothetical protein
VTAVAAENFALSMIIRTPHRPGAMTNQQLMLEYQRFRGNGANAARTEEFCESNEQVHRQKE